MVKAKKFSNKIRILEINQKDTLGGRRRDPGLQVPGHLVVLYHANASGGINNHPRFQDYLMTRTMDYRTKGRQEDLTGYT